MHTITTNNMLLRANALMTGGNRLLVAFEHAAFGHVAFEHNVMVNECSTAVKLVKTVVKISLRHMPIFRAWAVFKRKGGQRGNF